MIVFIAIGMVCLTIFGSVVDMPIDKANVPKEKTTTTSITSELKSYQVTKYYRTRTTEEIVYED